MFGCQAHLKPDQHGNLPGSLGYIAKQGASIGPSELALSAHAYAMRNAAAIVEKNAAKVDWEICDASLDEPEWLHDQCEKLHKRWKEQSLKLAISQLKRKELYDFIERTHAHIYEPD